MEPWVIIEIIIAIFGSSSIAGIVIQNKIQKLRSIEEKLREERRKVYAEVLLPFIEIFANPSNTVRAMERVSSLEFRQASFDLILVGSDEVVKAYGNLMQYIYKHPNDNNNNKEDKSSSTSEIMSLWATLLLEIRKSLGNKSTNLKEEDMLRHLIKDIERIDFK